jgi:Uma2 family endonuclease
LIEKATLYAEAAIVEYWIVDARRRCIHLFRDPTAGQFTHRSIAEVGEILLPIAPCLAPLVLKDLFD